MDIKEIALRIGEEADEYADAKLQSKGEFHPDWHTVRDEYFAEALVAEIANGNEPVGWYSKQYGFCYMHKQPYQFKVGSILYLKDGTPAWRIESACSKTALINMANIPHGTVFYEEVTIPPTASQIEQETAEAIAKYFEQSGIGGDCLAEGVRSGAWKEFK